MNLRTVMLGFLAQEDMTGYELKHLMERSVGYFFGASYGSIYPALKALEGDGLVESTLVVQSDRPNKKVYAITPEGRTHFREVLEEPPAGDSYRSEFLMRLFFGHLQDPAELLEMVRERRTRHEEAFRRLESVREEFAGVATPYQFMCLRSGLMTAERWIDFLDGIEQEIQALAEGPVSQKEGADVG